MPSDPHKQTPQSTQTTALLNRTAAKTASFNSLPFLPQTHQSTAEAQQGKDGAAAEGGGASQMDELAGLVRSERLGVGATAKPKNGLNGVGGGGVSELDRLGERLLGKRGLKMRRAEQRVNGGNGVKRRGYLATRTGAVDSSEDEEEGRASLGKRKRPTLGYGSTKEGGTGDGEDSWEGFGDGDEEGDGDVEGVWKRRADDEKNKGRSGAKLSFLDEMMAEREAKRTKKKRKRRKKRKGDVGGEGGG